MSSSSDLLNAPKEFLRLFKAGQDAARQGDHARAHDFFRRAIEVDPYHEQVWLWLASVVETDDDRRVCFENVLELNPSNPTARKQLQLLEQKVLVEMLNPEPVRHPRAPRGLRVARLVFASLIEVALIFAGWVVIVL